MDQETLYTATKWDILKLLEEQSRSPLEIANITGGSLANVSQILRLLEMAGLISSKRVPNRDKGQPRVLYSIAQDSCYVISTASNFVEKKLVTTTPTQQAMLRIWFLDNPEFRAYCEKAFWKVEEYLPDITELYVDTSGTSPINLYVISEKKLAIPHIQELRHGNTTRQMTVTRATREHVRDFGDTLFRIH